MRPKDSRLALGPAIRDIHRRTLLATLAENGLETPDEWDAAYLSRMEVPEAIQERYSGLFITEYEQGHGQRLAYTRLTAPVLGAMSISLLHSLTPTSNTIHRAEADPDNSIASHITLIDAPTKELSFWLKGGTYTSRRGNRLASVYVTRDAPPYTIHPDDLDFVREQLGPQHDHEDIELVPYVEEAFGPDSIEILSQEFCTDLIGILLHAKTSTPRNL